MQATTRASRALLLAPLTWALLSLAVSCDGDPGPPGPDPEPDPSPARCEPLKTERECFAAGCAFFANSALVVADPQDPQDPTRCVQTQPQGLCLYGEQTQGPPVLTSYLRELPDGRRQTVQLGVDVPLPGWRRCGPSSIPPDCGCEGR